MPAKQQGKIARAAVLPCVGNCLIMMLFIGSAASRRSPQAHRLGRES